jgi:hypothetical protein
VRTRRLAHSTIAAALLPVVISACFDGRGSGLTGVCCGGGTGGGSAPVLSEAFSGVVTVALASNPTGAALSGTTAVRASDGLASFPNLSIDRAGTYTLRASANGSAVTSSPFTITAATP